VKIYDKIASIQHHQKRGLAILLDPDKLQDSEKRKKIILLANECQADFFFVGGSHISGDYFLQCFDDIKAYSQIPSVLFPSSTIQLKKEADAMLFLSLISGRNPDLLIGQHVAAAPLIKQHNIEAISTGYMLINSGKSTTASYISNTQPIPHDKPEIASSTALAGELLGHKIIYLDGGSGAEVPVSSTMIHQVRETISTPLIVGGGIRTPKDAEKAYSSGADIIVIGTAFEENPDMIFDINSVRASHLPSL